MPFNPDLQLHALVVNLIATTDGRLLLTQGALAHAAFFDLVAAARLNGCLTRNTAATCLPVGLGFGVARLL